ncbi:hypothetical protein [Mycobacterium riyadhense]|uniref:hypothetical protein n=1 Tax=Mycobacterium riyadhense TaxID=486698 RepID=UPI001956B644|nr:hypothetical protein [Mycobacterium riyadhense]
MPVGHGNVRQAFWETLALITEPRDSVRPSRVGRGPGRLDAFKVEEVVVQGRIVGGVPRARVDEGFSGVTHEPPGDV